MTMMCRVPLDEVICPSAAARHRREEMEAEVECFDSYYIGDEQIVYHFFRCSLLNRWDCFDFDAAFEALIPTVEYKLDEHGLRDFESFVEKQEGIYCKYTLSDWVIENGYIYIDEDDVFRAIMKLWYDKFRDEFIGYSEFENIQDIYNRYVNRCSTTALSHEIELFDAMIHAHHVNGDVFEDMQNPDYIRADVEKELNGD